MKIRFSTILFLALATGAGLVLFQTSQNVQRSEQSLRRLQESLAKEEETLRVLETEWHYLNRPDRLEELARAHLKMKRPDLESLVSNSGAVRLPGKMIVPGRKPVFIAQPPAQVPAHAGVQSTPEVHTGADDLPMPTPITQDPRGRFDDLLNRLTTQEPAAGGTP